MRDVFFLKASIGFAHIRKLFEQLGEDEARYDFVSTYDELMDKVMH